MDKNKMNVSSVENFFYELLNGNVSNQVFRGGLPTAIQSTWNDMVVIDCSSSIRDMNSYGVGVVSILLYPSKNKGNGSKNIEVLDALDDKLNQAIEANTNNSYSINRAGNMAEYDTTRKLYYNVVFLNVKIY